MRMPLLPPAKRLTHPKQPLTLTSRATAAVQAPLLHYPRGRAPRKLRYCYALIAFARTRTTSVRHHTDG